MIKKLAVKNFKSIKDLEVDCKRVNIFIGKPNTGKSNILESVGVFSLFDAEGQLKDFLRFEDMSNLFYDQELSQEVEVTADRKFCQIISVVDNFRVVFGHETERGERGSDYALTFNYNGSGIVSVDGIVCMGGPLFKFYRFAGMREFPKKDLRFLLPPAGQNLLSLIQTSKALRKVVADIFREYGLRIVLKPQENRIEVQKEVEDIIVSYPYSLVSDTLQRIIFYLVAIETNKDSTLIFEEPEAHAFPLYTKLLAERIALDKTNQFFLSTHDPFFLLSILEKAPQQDVGIFITYLKDYQTQVKAIPEKRFEEVLDLGANLFFNFDLFLEKE